ncbi:MAG: polymerase delta subunit [Candidatus Parcubacteria bacterium]|jgi:DNA polymerase III delta prime subunit
MQSPFQILETKTSGSFLFVGDREYFEKEFNKLGQNNEIQLFSYINCGIEDIRNCIVSFTNKSPSQRHVAISFYSIGHEAQNALLKFLEEPPERLTISLLTYPHTKLLATILSRVQKIESTDEQSVYAIEARKYLETEPVERAKIPFYKKLLLQKYEGEEKINKEQIQNFFLEVFHQYTQLASNDIKIANKHSLERSHEIFARISQNSAQIKQIAEYISLSLPKV